MADPTSGTTFPARRSVRPGTGVVTDAPPNPNDFSTPQDYVNAVRVRQATLAAKDDALLAAIQTAQEAVKTAQGQDATNFTNTAAEAEKSLQLASAAYQQNQQLQAGAVDDLRNGIALVFKVKGLDMDEATKAKLQQETQYWVDRQAETALNNKKADLEMKILQAAGSPEEQAALLKDKARIDSELQVANTARVKSDTAHQDFQNGLDQKYGPLTAQSGLDTAAANRAKIKSDTAGQDITNTYLPAREQAITDLYGQQIEQAKQAAAATALKIHQDTIGEIQTLKEQLAKAVDDPSNPMDPAQASDILWQKVRGITLGEAQKNANQAALDLYGKNLQAGTVVSPGQRYTVGAEPGGALSQAFSKVGLQFPTTELHPQTAAQMATNAGVNIDPRQGIPTTPLFGPMAASVPRPVAAGAAAAPTGAPAMAGTVAPPGGFFYTPDQLRAMLLGQQPKTPQVVPPPQPAAPAAVPQIAGVTR